MTNIKIRTAVGNYELKDTNKTEVEELLKLCRKKRQEVLELTIHNFKEIKNV